MSSDPIVGSLTMPCPESTVYYSALEDLDDYQDRYIIFTLNLKV